VSVGITRDNIHLSEVIRARSQIASDDFCTKSSVHGCSDLKILEFLEVATASSTRRAYDSDLRHYQAWGGAIPTSDRVIARYLADHAGGLAISTLTRRLVAIRLAHAARGLPDPTKSELVRLTFRGIRRKHGQPQRRVAALGTDDLLAIVRSLGESVRDIRDAAIMLVGFAGAFRRSELSSLDCNDVEIGTPGAAIVIRRI
jgi:integrase